MDTLYLIAHKVRGEPAFDVAIKLDMQDEDGDDWWIIPTSGHRAYPYWHTSLQSLNLAEDRFGSDWRTFEERLGVPPTPSGWPDHYRGGPAPKLDIKTLFKPEPKPTIPRRL